MKCWISALLISRQISSNCILSSQVEKSGISGHSTVTWIVGAGVDILRGGMFCGVVLMLDRVLVVGWVAWVTDDDVS